MDCVLYQNVSKSITIIDIPASLELSQVRHGNSSPRRIISTPPLEKPYPSIEPKSSKAASNLAEPTIQELLLEKHLQLALEKLREDYHGPWYLPREVGGDRTDEITRNEKRMKKNHVFTQTDDDRVEEGAATSRNERDLNVKQHEGKVNEDCPERQDTYIPQDSHYILGSISETLSTFITLSPTFDLIIMDPPWPNRSARRARTYSACYDIAAAKDLLRLLPLPATLAENGLIGVWITNKASVRALVLDEGGLFDSWNVELIEEWTWLKVTATGEPVSAIEGRWRKPYEIFLLGRMRSKGLRSKENDMGGENGSVRRRVVISVPDVHSRKPNLRSLIRELLPENYQALEIFARHLTAGWWAWGNEVLKFQRKDWWLEREECVMEEA